MIIGREHLCNCTCSHTPSPPLTGGSGMFTHTLPSPPLTGGSGMFTHTHSPPLSSPHRWFRHVFHPSALSPEELTDHTSLHLRVMAGLLVEGVTTLHCGFTVAVGRCLSEELIKLVDFWEKVVLLCLRVVLRRSGGGAPHFYHNDL